MNITLDKVSEILKILNIGNSFRIFGGFGLLISLWTGNELVLKISLITFIFGALARAIENLNKLWPENTAWQVFIWLCFLISYSLLINNHIQIF